MQFIILGCGSSMGVPRPDGFFGNCDPNNKKNYRTRCSALLKTTNENILIDKTSADLLKGSEVDYVSELIGEQFKITNPQTKSSCGCGVSFSL